MGADDVLVLMDAFVIFQLWGHSQLVSNLYGHWSVYKRILLDASCHYRHNECALSFFAPCRAGGRANSVPTICKSAFTDQKCKQSLHGSLAEHNQQELIACIPPKLPLSLSGNVQPSKSQLGSQDVQTLNKFLHLGMRESQADRKRPPPPLLSAFCDFFWCVFIIDYDSLCYEMDFTPETSFSSNYKNCQLLPTAAAALSQNGQIAVQQRL